MFSWNAPGKRIGLRLPGLQPNLPENGYAPAFTLAHSQYFRICEVNFVASSRSLFSEELYSGFYYRILLSPEEMISTIDGDE